MCGIIGYVGINNAATLILDGLKKLEYRGYDSAGIAYINTENKMDIVRCKGKMNELFNKVNQIKPQSFVGIGHTRWATHGSPTENNAHPHRVGSIAIVHNGIIENFIELKQELLVKGKEFKSDTDTEVICHIINDYYTEGVPLEDAVRKTVKRLNGSYALNVLSEREPGKIVCARKDSPLVIGLGEGEYFSASDVPAFLSSTRDVVFMEDGEIAILTKDGVEILDFDGVPVHREPIKITWSSAMAEKGGYKHFMLKEIYEEPRAIADTITGRINSERAEVNLYEFGLTASELKNIKKIFISACGTSWHAGLCGKYMIESLARVPVEVDISSEFRYRKPIIRKGDLFISITQSGETADTLAALREAKKCGASALTICNVVGSTASRESDHVFYTHSGPEIGVASTKAFVTQLVSLYLFALALAPNHSDTEELIKDLLHLPALFEQILLMDTEIEKLARTLHKANDFLFLGRGILYPIALEGALKLKEISYIHAEGYPAGEMKHGPIALIDDGLPVVILLSKDALYEKVLSNIEEVKSRGGTTIVVSNYEDAYVRNMAHHFISVPFSNIYLNSVLMTAPLQLLAYHIAVIRGCDVDQPRNLAKSVTVE
ncbi:glutamine--fructose-6-phosphate transaminase (isomerizing) [Candidatus Magnetomonas plexicatena]|uniref:glutamine--fructose-6-phosphate transaminase (isomerizing) n=1 Tax=Candidatus Magnetomonas plexicatena TaxID=2552947 RepID=UPI001102308C|nr:glutamine--fructose-6-phosphate transaminase (isomerizing) [Nitrospirales bacterium LBB_01]